MMPLRRELKSLAMTLRRGFPLQLGHGGVGRAYNPRAGYD